MAVASELVTLLRYQLDKSGLTAYITSAKTAAREASAAVQSVGRGWHKTLDDVLKKRGITLRQLRMSVREQVNLNRAQKQSARNAREIGNGYRQIVGYLRMALGGVGIIGAAHIADEWMGVEARIGLVTDGLREQQHVLKELFATSQYTGQDYLSIGSLFYSIQRNAKNLDLSSDQSVRLSEVIGKAMTIGGGPIASQQAALVQLSQALGSGELRGQELRSVLEQAPRLAQAIAEAFDVPIGQLIKLGEKGELTSKELADGLLRIGEKIDAEFERMPKTFGRGATLIRNELGRMIWQWNRASAASRGFYAVSKLIADNLTSIVKLGAMLLLTGGALKLAAVLGAINKSVGLLAARFMVVARRVGLVRAAALFLARAGRSVLWPFLRMYAVLETIRLIGDDILTWLRGGRSVLGGLIGRSEEWRDQIDAVKRPLSAIRDMLPDISGRWIAIGTLAIGFGLILKWLLGPVIALGKAIMVRLVLPLAALFFATFGWPGLIVAAMAAIIVIMVAKWDQIKEIINGVWDSVTDYFKAKWTGALDWIERKVKALTSLLPDSWVQSSEDASATRAERGRNDPRNPWRSYQPNMSLLQRPGGGNQQITNSGNVTNNVTVTAPTNSPASVARTASQAVSRVTPPRQLRWTNVEAMP